MSRYLLAVVLAASAAVLTSSSRPPYTARDKAFYLDPAQVNFVRPGLMTRILSAQIAPDGTIQARLRITDPRGLPLDREGITTPGAVSLSLMAAYIPQGQLDYVAYTTRPQTSPITGQTAVQPAADTGGTFQRVGEGEYLYTFGVKAPANFDRNATHSIGVWSSRNLAEFDLGTQFSDDVFHFVPGGGAVTQVHDIVRTQTCNKCHDPLMAHGGSRQKVELCVLCHNPQAVDPDTGRSVDFPVMVHKIHMGEELPSVQAGQPYRIIGFQQGVNDYSTVVFPAVSPANCQFCHEPGPVQANVWLTMPSRAACGSCHDNVNFATGENHANLPQLTDNQCSTCHVPQGELEFDVSIRGAHTLPSFSSQLPGVVFTLERVDSGIAGNQPTVTFTLKDRAGNPIDASRMDFLNLVMAGPTRDYATIRSESVRSAQGPGNGVYYWTMGQAVPADAHGTWAIGIEGYRNATLNPGTVQQMTVRDVGLNKVIYFSVDGTPVAPRRTVATNEQCNQCHFQVSAHGTIRNRVEHCLLCHNPLATDAAQRPASAAPPQTIDFRTLIHRIHTGEEMESPFVVYGFGGRPFDFSEVRFSGDRRNCAKCHVDQTWQLPLPDDRLAVVNPRGFINPTPPETAACLSCHTSQAAAAHAANNISGELGEACAVCHGTGAQFSVDREHAR